MRAGEFDAEYRDVSKDRQDRAEFSDTRKPRMTLLNLNKLKKMRAAQDLENAMRMDTLEIIYSPSEASPGGM